MKAEEVKEIANFIFEHYPASWTWKEDDLRGWIEWLTHMGFFFVIRNEGKIAGLCCCRPISIEHVSDAGQFDDRHDESSPFLYADFILGDNSCVLRGVAEALVSRYGKKNLIFYRRQGGPVRVRDFAPLMNHMAKEKIL